MRAKCSWGWSWKKRSWSHGAELSSGWYAMVPVAGVWKGGSRGGVFDEMCSSRYIWRGGVVGEEEDEEDQSRSERKELTGDGRQVDSR